MRAVGLFAQLLFLPACAIHELSVACRETGSASLLSCLPEFDQIKLLSVLFNGTISVGFVRGSTPGILPAQSGVGPSMASGRGTRRQREFSGKPRFLLIH